MQFRLFTILFCVIFLTSCGLVNNQVENYTKGFSTGFFNIEKPHVKTFFNPQGDVNNAQSDSHDIKNGTHDIQANLNNNQSDIDGSNHQTLVAINEKNLKPKIMSASENKKNHSSLKAKGTNSNTKEASSVTTQASSTKEANHKLCKKADPKDLKLMEKCLKSCLLAATTGWHAFFISKKGCHKKYGSSL